MTLNDIQMLSRIKTPKIGLLGGTFDPIHNGHIAMARAAMDAYQLDVVWLLISRNPPHKNDVTDAELRFQMAELACKTERNIEPSRFELERTGTTYTIDTLEDLIPKLPESAELYYIIGTDTMYDLKNWKRYHDVVSRVSFIVIPRSGYSEAEAFSYFLTLSIGERARIARTMQEAPNISSTNIRRRVAQQLSIEGLVRPEVEEIIWGKQLYQNAALSFEKVRDTLKTELSPKRYEHTLRVVKTAEKLAQHYGMDLSLARWAALLHDCGKEIAHEPIEDLAVNFGLAQSEEFTYAPQLIHAPLSALIAKQRFGMDDPAVLSAVEKHTTGDENMSKLDKIIFLADAIEPGRAYDGLERLQTVAHNDLDEATMLALEASINSVLRVGGYVAPKSVAAHNALWIERFLQQQS